MINPNDLNYTKEHVWVKINGSLITVGITDAAQSLMGDVVYIELPATGDEYTIDEPMARIESVKAVSDVISPVSGKVSEVNTVLESSPEVINEEPYGGGWIAVLEVSDPAQLDGLLSVEEYGRLLVEGEEQ